jgi:hypothetical protein
MHRPTNGTNSASSSIFEMHSIQQIIVIYDDIFIIRRHVIFISLIRIICGLSTDEHFLG